MTWKQLTERDRRKWKLSAIDPHDRDTWRSGVRSAMCAASQLPGRGPMLWIWPLYLHVNKKSDDDDDDDDKVYGSILMFFCHIYQGMDTQLIILQTPPLYIHRAPNCKHAQALCTLCACRKQWQHVSRF